MISQNQEIIYKDESYNIQGAIFEVYREIGCGFLEAVYQECLAREFISRSIPFVNQIELPVHYKGITLPVSYRADFVCYGKIIMEIKAIKETGSEHKAQLLNYLKISGLRLGLLVNFGHHPKATIERVVN